MNKKERSMKHELERKIERESIPIVGETNAFTNVQKLFNRTLLLINAPGQRTESVKVVIEHGAQTGQMQFLVGQQQLDKWLQTGLGKLK